MSGIDEMEFFLGKVNKRRKQSVEARADACLCLKMKNKFSLTWTSEIFSEVQVKAELLQEGIFFPHPFICTSRFSNEKVRNQKN